MNKELYISASCTIINNKITIDNQVIAQEDEDLDFTVFAKKIYKDNQLKYPKFFKMDRLSKLAFLGAEFLFSESGILNQEEENNIAIVLSNRASSLDTDRKHQSSIEDKTAYFPSPSVFVYTLPNIAIGEISIRHQLYSENAFFVFENFNAEFLEKYCSSLIHHQKANSVLCGWVDFDKNDYHAFLYLLTQREGMLHNAKNINHLMTQGVK